MSKGIKGFTLIELMVSVGILAVLSTVGLVYYQSARISSQNAARNRDAQTIAGALELHFNGLTNQFCTATARTYCPLQAVWFEGSQIPKDPGSDRQYCIASSTLSMPADPTSTGWTASTCPTGYAAVSALTPTAGSGFWKVCILTSKNVVSCLQSLQ